ncbi:hypothetical protein TSAR_013318 [Trichomalopsis sarcophagae]|uniref:Uncharacterized protein n=1 Tax=Trichomalopsis sarcophagae TaxID=543379 RepID=A0A232EIR4_9HYME|nr:hypothetical protein TSAR_013318 [Trichomalopsis sarcophagae]
MLFICLGLRRTCFPADNGNQTTKEDKRFHVPQIQNFPPHQSLKFVGNFASYLPATQPSTSSSARSPKTCL